MAITFDPSGDFEQVADGLETVHLLREGSSFPHGTAKARRRPVSRKEAEMSGGAYTTSDSVWEMRIPNVHTLPLLGEKILGEDGQAWQIVDLSHTVMQTRCKCICRLTP